MSVVGNCAGCPGPRDDFAALAGRTGACQGNLFRDCCVDISSAGLGFLPSPVLVPGSRPCPGPLPSCPLVRGVPALVKSTWVIPAPNLSLRAGPETRSTAPLPLLLVPCSTGPVP